MITNVRFADEAARGHRDQRNGVDYLPGETYEWQEGWNAAAHGWGVDEALSAIITTYENEEALYGQTGKASGLGVGVVEL